GVDDVERRALLCGRERAVDEVVELAQCGRRCHGDHLSWHAPSVGGTSSAGLRSKKPNGLSQKETVSTGITGQSSGRVMWWMPKTYQSTTSVLSIERFCAVHLGSPSSSALWTTNSPHGQRSSCSYGVTQRVWPITWARRNTGESGSIMTGKQAPGPSL